MATGMSAVESYLKGGGGGGGSTAGRYLSYFILDDGDTKVVRFLTDDPELHVANFYEFVLDRNGKYQNFVVAPDYFSNDPSWQGEDWVRKFGGKTTDYSTKELVDPSPRKRVVGLAVEREEVSSEVEGRRIISTRDLLNRYEARDGKQYDARNFLIVKQSKAFWNTLVGYFHEFGTLCDRDYKITRNGTGRDIVYSIIPKNPDPDWNNDGSSLAALQARYGYGTGKDVDGAPVTPESEDRYLYCTQTLKDWMDNQASEERARAALVADGDTFTADTTPPPSWATTANDEPQSSSPAPAVGGTDVADLRARLERHR